MRAEQWNPPLSGNINICIKANGDWFHDGVKFTRQPLIDLFASILKKEHSEYFLVTPVEKWRIRVEDAPLLVIDHDIDNAGAATQSIILKTSTGDIFALDAQHPLQMRPVQEGHELKPYVVVRNNLEARIQRAVFYALAERAEEQNGHFGVRSGGTFHILG